MATYNGSRGSHVPRPGELSKCEVSPQALQLATMEVRGERWLLGWPRVRVPEGCVRTDFYEWDNLVTV